MSHFHNTNGPTLLQEEVNHKTVKLNHQLANDLAIEQKVHMRDVKTGKNVLLPLWVEGAKMLYLGRGTMLYLIFARWTFFFFFLLSILNIPQVYFYYTSQDIGQNIWYRFSIANWQSKLSSLLFFS